MRKDTIDFLEALLWAYTPDENGENPMDDKSVYDFSPEFVAGVDSFLSGFRDYLAGREIDIPDSQQWSFGANVYFSLSGHGVGFWDSSDTKHLQEHLVAYSGDKYRFEQIDLCEDDNGKLDLSFIPEALPEYREKLFSVTH
jgi:hypothetical protein